MESFYLIFFVCGTLPSVLHYNWKGKLIKRTIYAAFVLEVVFVLFFYFLFFGLGRPGLARLREIYAHPHLSLASCAKRKKLQWFDSNCCLNFLSLYSISVAFEISFLLWANFPSKITKNIHNFASVLGL